MTHPPSAPPLRTSTWPLTLGWILTLPGLWVIASFLLYDPVSRYAGCPPVAGMTFPPCPPGAAGAFADALRSTVLFTVLASFVGVGILPPLYAGLFIAMRMARRFGLWMSGVAPTGWRLWLRGVVLLFGFFMMGGMISRLMEDWSAPDGGERVTTGLIGMIGLALLIYGVLRLWRWLRHRPANA